MVDRLKTKQKKKPIVDIINSKIVLNGNRTSTTITNTTTATSSKIKVDVTIRKDVPMIIVIVNA